MIKAVIEWVNKTFGPDTAAVILIIVILGFVLSFITGILSYIRGKKTTKEDRFHE